LNDRLFVYEQTHIQHLSKFNNPTVVRCILHSQLTILEIVDIYMHTLFVTYVRNICFEHDSPTRQELQELIVAVQIDGLQTSQQPITYSTNVAINALQWRVTFPKQTKIVAINSQNSYCYIAVD